MTLLNKIPTDGLVYRKKAYKNALAVYLLLLGITAYAGGLTGLGRYLLASVGGQRGTRAGVGRGAGAVGHCGLILSSQAGLCVGNNHPLRYLCRHESLRGIYPSKRHADRHIAVFYARMVDVLVSVGANA